MSRKVADMDQQSTSSESAKGPAALPKYVRIVAVLSALVALVFFSSRAEALDPERPLSQCLRRIWQVQQGLPQATIFSICQSQDGFIWLGTRTGLVRFDGLRFTMIHDRGGVSLENVWIQDLCVDSANGLWIATDGAGLIHLEETSAVCYTSAEGLPSDNVRCVLLDKNGAVWAGTDQGVARLSRGKFTVYRTEEGLAANDVRAMCETSDGQLWIGGDGDRLSLWDGTKFTTRRLESLRPHGSVRALLSSRDGALWIGTTTGLVRIKEDRERRYTAADGLADEWVHCLTESTNGSLWVGTKEGFSRIYQDEIESFRTRDGLSQSTVYTLCEDREGSLWVGTKHGLNQFVDRRTIPLTTSEGLPSNDTGPVFQDAAGNIWVGTLDAGLGRYDGRGFSVFTNEQGLASNTIVALADGKEGELWIGTNQGLNLMRDGKVVQTYTTEQGLPSDIVRCLLRDHAGILWVGTSAGLAEFRDGKFVQPDGEPNSQHLPILALVEHRGKFIFAAAEDGGLYRYADRRFDPFPADGPTTRGVDAFYEDTEGLLWMGTHGDGLRMLDGDKMVQFTTRDGLHDDDIFGIVADDQDRLWMACSQGLFYVKRDDLRKFAAGKLKTLKSMPFSPMEAQRTIECKGGVQPAAWKMRDGQIWFSTIRGLLVIRPDRLVRKFPPTPVVVEEVTVNGKAENPREIKTLSPGQTNLSFRYTALSYVVPSRLTFRYFLEGFDQEWIDAGSRREAFYTNLPPGSYRFRVAAHNVDGSENEAAVPIAFTLEPHFYQTGWFLPLCGALLVAAGAIAYRLRVSRIKEHMRVVVAERNRIARELHDTLMQGFSGVTMEMQALSSRLPPSRERTSLEDIIRDAGVCLREARLSVAGLRSAKGEETGLTASIAEAARLLTETHDFSLKLSLGRTPRGLPADVEYNLLRIVQEAVSNAVKHSGGSTIEVSVDCDARDLRISVKDDGVGFVAASGERSRPGHYGLIGMRERASQIKANFQLDSEPGRGTTIRVTLPLAHQAHNGAAVLDHPPRVSTES
jgi:signal transduction histidine kinase/ligand-binding sensor domain-containing protein